MSKCSNCIHNPHLKDNFESLDEKEFAPSVPLPTTKGTMSKAKVSEVFLLEFIRKTAKASLWKHESVDKAFWMPNSQLDVDTTDCLEGDTLQVKVPAWLIDDKGLMQLETDLGGKPKQKYPVTEFLDELDDKDIPF